MGVFPEVIDLPVLVQVKMAGELSYHTTLEVVAVVVEVQVVVAVGAVDVLVRI